jgi:hypothetical protein
MVDFERSPEYLSVQNPDPVAAGPVVVKWPRSRWKSLIVEIDILGLPKE